MVLNDFLWFLISLMLPETANKDESESHEAKVILIPNNSSETKTSHPSNSASL